MLRKCSVARIRFNDRKREWIKRIAGAMLEAKQLKQQKFAEKFRRTYVEKQYTPVGEVFPLMDSARWDSISPERQKSIQQQLTTEKVVQDPHLVRVAIVGPPNSGKSAIFNACVHANVSPIATKTNTTKNWVKGITTVHNTQIILLDTPPVMDFFDTAEYKISSSSQKAWDSLQGCDVCLAVFPGMDMVLPKIRSFLGTVIKRCGQHEIPCILVVSKVDKVYKSAFRKENHFHLRNALELWRLPFETILEISAKNFTGIVDLKDYLARYAKPSPWVHHKGEITTIPLPDQINMLLRASMLRVLELPVVEQLETRILSWDEKYVRKNRDNLPAVKCVVEVYHTHKWALAQFTGKIEKIANEAQVAILHRLKQKFTFTFYNFVRLDKG